MRVERPPLPLGPAVWAVTRCATRTAVLLFHRCLHRPRHTSAGDVPSLTARRPRSTERPLPTSLQPRRRRCSSSASGCVACAARRAHAVFRLESVLNTVLFAGFPGFVSKLWFANDDNGVYRGLYDWDDPDLAEAYVGALWWVLALVSIPASIHYVVLPDHRRDELLADPQLAAAVAPDEAGAWWRLTSTGPGAVSDTDLVVVGAGPTGLALALQASDLGARVRVVERRTEAFRPSRALIVHPRTLEVLRPLGVTDALLASGDVAPPVNLHLGRREIPIRLGNFDLPDTAFPALLFQRQAVVEAILSEALADRGIEIDRGVELVDVRCGVHDAELLLRRAGGVEPARCRTWPDAMALRARFGVSLASAGMAAPTPTRSCSPMSSSTATWALGRPTSSPGGMACCSCSRSASAPRGGCSPPGTRRAKHLLRWRSANCKRCSTVPASRRGSTRWPGRAASTSSTASRRDTAPDRCSSSATPPT